MQVHWSASCLCPQGHDTCVQECMCCMSSGVRHVCAGMHVLHVLRGIRHVCVGMHMLHVLRGTTRVCRNPRAACPQGNTTRVCRNAHAACPQGHDTCVQECTCCMSSGAYNTCVQECTCTSCPCPQGDGHDAWGMGYGALRVRPIFFLGGDAPNTALC